MAHHFAEAVDKVMLGERMDRRPEKAELWRVAIHETGHALLSEWQRPGSVAQITTTPRGKALGYLRQSPLKDCYLATEEDLLGQIAVMVAGSVAEELVLGNRSTGAANDFQQAIEVTKQLIGAGLSSLGIVSPADLPQQLLHREIQKIIAREEEKVKVFLSPQKDFISELAGILVAEEKISGELLRSRLAGKRIVKKTAV